MAKRLLFPGDLLSTIAESFSWTKLLYTAILISIIVLLVSEIGRLWLDRRAYVGKFQFFEAGDDKPAEGKAFALQLLHHHRTMTDLLALEPSRRTETEIESTWWPREVAPINEPKSALADMELSVQGINVKDILSKLRQWVSTPNEITGTVDKGAGGLRVTVVWPKGPSRREHGIDGQLLRIEGQPDASAASFRAACHLIWAQAAKEQDDLKKTSPQDFCDWAEAWTTYLDLYDRAKRINGLNASDAEEIKKLRSFLTRLLDRKASYPEIYRLRADLVDLLPDDQRTEEDLTQAQQDRIRYTFFTDPEKSKLSPEKALYMILAEARPALVLQQGKLITGPSETWEELLSEHAENISAAANATGIGWFRSKQGRSVYFSGFAIAPGIILTASHSLIDLEGATYPFALGDQYEGAFSFGDEIFSPEQAKEKLPIREVLFASDQLSLALLRIEGHDSAQHPPLVIDPAREGIQSWLSHYAFVVGYPFHDFYRLPRPFVEALLGDKQGLKRLMPGRIVRINEDGTITSDISSTAGTGGGPLVDLQSGRVLGLHMGGRWQNEKLGKFAEAKAFSTILADPNLPSEIGDVLLGRARPVAAQ